MGKIDGTTKRSFFSISRRGIVLPITIIVMLVFMILCAGTLVLSQMNVSHVTFFERRNVLEQATLSLAQTLADEILENANLWWSLDPTAAGKGELGVDSGINPDIPKMKFTYEVSPDKFRSYILFVRGEYVSSGFSKNAIWGVSLDIRPDVSVKLPIRWSKPVQLD
jgi:hypothetical protein